MIRGIPANLLTVILKITYMRIRTPVKTIRLNPSFLTIGYKAYAIAKAIINGINISIIFDTIPTHKPLIKYNKQIITTILNWIVNHWLDENVQVNSLLNFQ